MCRRGDHDLRLRGENSTRGFCVIYVKILRVLFARRVRTSGEDGRLLKRFAPCFLTVRFAARVRVLHIFFPFH